MKQTLLGLFIVLLGLACNSDKLDDPIDQQLFQALSEASPNQAYEHFILPDGTDLAAIPQDIHNPLSPQKIALGKLLFYESCFSTAAVHPIGEMTYSCASCHIPSAGFMPGRIQGIADGGAGFGQNGESRDIHPTYAESEMDVQGIRPLSMINVAYVKNTSWNGQFGAGGINEGTEDRWGISDPGTALNHLGFEGLESQNIAGLELHRMVFDKAVIAENDYLELFDQVFAEVPEEERYSAQSASFAISAYLRSLLSNRAPFQDYLRGETNAMSRKEKEGALLFFGKAGCYRCHNDPNLGSVRFYTMGVKDLVDAGGFQTDENDKKNLGRGAFTGLAEDDYKFKIPQLYNLKDAAFFFHGSSKRSLREVVDYFNAGIPENPRIPQELIAPQLTPLQLTEPEVTALVAFLENGLYDAQMDRYVPEVLLSGNCIPNNDDASKADLGCE